MTRYLLYFLTGVATATVILFFRGYVHVPQNVYSDAALLAGMVLFGLASWVTLFRIKLGAVVALLCSLALVPWLIRIGLRVWAAGSEAPQVVQFIHIGMSVLALFSLIVSARYTFSRGSWRSGTAAPATVVKLFLMIIPLAVVAGWLLVMDDV
ncbi:hypothetical protein [Pontibacter akesuensis]|uniref:Uncharacterized protein n=1 Tax=Pontibacter akesuensis TaxID=388950 RepID=A0A1I7HZZ2_9BACT|nr:hypothetical protein [Pontibacter akesuensis]GHA64448.1 hypothetical protein GCM10007389_16460 [Pontibacter akesuensis]SFU66250.1 hypothetical protein SAMN04487941_1807 [Pontibacter akesuensis]